MLDKKTTDFFDNQHILLNFAFRNRRFGNCCFEKKWKIQQ